MEKLSAVFTALVEHLRKECPTRYIRFIAKEYDPTYGDREVTVDMEVVDFDALMRSIDAFGETLRERGQ